MKVTKYIVKENPEIRYIGLFGSRARKNNFLNSDIDLVLLGSIKQDLKEMGDKIALYFGAPKADIYLVKRESIEHPTVNPKTITMGLDLVELWKNKDENEVRLNIGEINPIWFCAFLEYERLRTLNIFGNKKPTYDYVKKMPGGRRSYDEISWLSRLAKRDINLHSQLEDHLSRIKSEMLNVDWNKEINKQANLLDKVIFNLECSLIKGLNSIGFRGDPALNYLFPDLKLAFCSSDPIELERLYDKNQNLGSQDSWLIQYGLAFNNYLLPHITEKIALMQRADLFDYEIKKSLLQNRVIKKTDYSKTLEILCEDNNQIVRRYANIVRDPSYIQNLPAYQRKFLRDNINHLL